jgi:hypothetical protein
VNPNRLVDIGTEEGEGEEGRGEGKEVVRKERRGEKGEEDRRQERR